MNLFSETSDNIVISHILLETRFFGVHFYRGLYGSVFNHFYVIGPIGPKFGRVVQNNRH